MRAYETSIDIAASPERVWAVLVDGAGYPGWDSGVERVDGTVALGQRITVYATIAAGRAFPVTVADFVPNSRMVWRGGMPLGLFTGVRTFALTPQDGGTRFAMREEFSGPLLPLIWRSMPDLQPSFDRFAAGLKQQAETAAH